jgi:hypothetical protein
MASFKDVGACDRETANTAFGHTTDPSPGECRGANDQMALGVVKAMKDLRVAQPVVVSGMDWDKRLLEIGQDRMRVSVGGQFWPQPNRGFALRLFARFNLLNERTVQGRMAPFQRQCASLARFCPRHLYKFSQFSRQTLG